MPTDHEIDIPLTEPVIIDCVYVTGATIEADDNVVRIVCWTTMPDLGGEMAERRITVRMAMPIGAARALRNDLAARLKRGHHH